MERSFIFLVDDVISKDDCDKLISIIDNNSKEETLSIAKTNVKAKLTRLEYLENKTEVEEILVKPISKIIKIIKRYGLSLRGCSEPMLRKIYGPTQRHTDSVISVAPLDGMVDINEIRCMSVVIALNDNYEGGEFCFPLQNYEIKMKSGQALLFPPFWTHPHHTNDLKNETFRYTITTWLNGEVD